MLATRASRTAERNGDSSPIDPRPRNLAYAPPRPARTEGASRGVERPGGRAVSVAKERRKLERARPRRVQSTLRPAGSFHHGGVSSFRAGTPVQPAAQHGESSHKNRARGCAGARGDASTSRQRNSARSRRLRRRPTPRPPSDGVSFDPSRRRAGGASRMVDRFVACTISARVVPGGAQRRPGTRSGTVPIEVQAWIPDRRGFAACPG